MLPRPAIRSAVKAPDPIASTGISYDNFSSILDKLVRPEEDGDRPNSVERFKYVMDKLYGAIRLRQWKHMATDASHPSSFEIWNSSRTVRVTVTAERVEIAQGMATVGGTHKYRVVNGLDANNLFNSIQHAQGIIRTSLSAPEDETDEEYFEPGNFDASSALDSVFSDMGQSADMNKAAAQETVQVQQEYEKDDPKKCAPSMYENEILRHVKSLQGRILTIIDASLSDKQQREAVKTLANKEFRREMEKIGKHFLDPNSDQSEGE